MKIQYLAVLFIIIILPIYLVISYYVNAQIKTVNAQELYDSKLVTATYDSVRSFQLNTINNKYSSVSDSKIRDIEAAISSFFNSLGTELGATGYSREDLSTFIPAILYSMYDGYYVYGKYYDEGIPIEYDEQGKVTKSGDYRIGLKPYVYYSCRYKEGSSSDFVVNYTLDNTITVYGKVNGDEVASTGALVKIGDVEVNSTDIQPYSFLTSTGKKEERSYAKHSKYKQIDINPEILSEKLVLIEDLDGDGDQDITVNNYEYIVHNDQKIYVDKKDGDVAKYDLNEYIYYDGNGNQYPGIKCFVNYRNKKQYLTDLETMAFINEMVYEDVGGDGHTHLHSNSACQYYYDAYKFSVWVNDNLGNITQADAKDLEGNTITDFETNTGSEKIFRLSDNKNDPMLESSTFNQQRINVIKKSIKSNLAAEMANFGAKNGYEYRMPELTEEDWDKIVNDMCVTTFMQGMSIGMKYYNNYCVVPNDKNKEVVTLDSIYIIESTNDNIIDSNDEVHYAGCEELVNSTKTMMGYRNIDFERQTVVTSDDNNYYFYPHDNTKSYNCMVNAKNQIELESIITGEKLEYDIDQEMMVKKGSIGYNLRKTYLTALAREKYDLYRTNGYFGVPD